MRGHRITIISCASLFICYFAKPLYLFFSWQSTRYAKQRFWRPNHQHYFQYSLSYCSMAFILREDDEVYQHWFHAYTLCIHDMLALLCRVSTVMLSGWLARDVAVWELSGVKCVRWLTLFLCSRGLRHVSGLRLQRWLGWVTLSYLRGPGFLNYRAARLRHLDYMCCSMNSLILNLLRHESSDRCRRSQRRRGSGCDSSSLTWQSMILKFSKTPTFRSCFR